MDEPGELRDGELRLVLAERTPADPEKGPAGAYLFKMVHAETGEQMGRLWLRPGWRGGQLFYGGNVGYAVEPRFRGRRYSARACRLVLPLAKRCGLAELWMTCTPENIASCRTCEILGAELVETVDVPPGNEVLRHGERRMRRYRIRL